MFCAACIGIIGAYTAHRETLAVAEHDALAHIVLDSDNSPLVVMDQYGKVIKWNAGMEALTGYSCDEARKDGIASLMCDAQRMIKHQKGFDRAFSDPELRHKLTVVRCELRNKDGMVIPVRISVRIYSTNDGERYAVARVDRESQIVEYGKNAVERVGSAVKTTDSLFQEQPQKAAEEPK